MDCLKAEMLRRMGKGSGKMRSACQAEPMAIAPLGLS